MNVGSTAEACHRVEDSDETGQRRHGNRPESIPRSAGLIDFLDELSDIFAFANQRRPLQAEERDSLACRTEHQPAGRRHTDHESIR